MHMDLRVTDEVSSRCCVSDDNVCAASNHKLQKFSRDGPLIKCVGQHGSKDGEYISPTGVKSTMVMCLFLRQFGQEEGEGNLKWPTAAVHVMGQFVYIK